ncbi:hypothetical protein OBBRIDRAFT_782819 [Obba rivulosa]|uniref:Uncharacterized protein n=1 Tax=Obba rivulosa TaxID=1052685 RepID=A0A8E2AWJ6_9APHY|nr:hypothetical protein OBBRIDRAFT_782819 [Obba rivulosa]
MSRASALRNADFSQELDNMGYVFPQCRETFSPLDADKLYDPFTNTFNCDICKAEVIEGENAESVRDSQDRMQRYIRQIQFIRQGLRKTEDMILPAFDVALRIKKRIIDVEQAKAAAQGGGLKIAGASGETKQEDAFGIVLSVGKAIQRAERDKEAAAKRQQNVLPAWPLKSTISSDLTALSIRESAREQTVAPPEVHRLPSSHDAGLSAAQPTIETPREELQPIVGQPDGAGYYDQYYAPLAASAAPSASAIPGMQDMGSDFGDEEEDIKPSAEYLDESLNEYRKRPRSPDDIDGQTATPKVPWTKDFVEAPHVTAATSQETVVQNLVTAEEAVLSFLSTFSALNGEPAPLSQVTPEHEEWMSPEEYTAYFEIISARQ